MTGTIQQAVAWASANRLRAAILAAVVAAACYWAYKRYQEKKAAAQAVTTEAELTEGYQDKKKEALKGNFLVADKVANEYKQGQQKSNPLADTMASAAPIVPPNVQLPPVDAQLKPVSSTMGAYDKVYDIRGAATPEEGHPAQTLTQVSPAFLDAQAATMAKSF